MLQIDRASSHTEWKERAVEQPFPSLCSAPDFAQDLS